MNVLDVYTFKSSNVSMMAKKLKPKSYNIDLLYNGTSFMLQTPVCTIEKIERTMNEVKSLDVSFVIQKNFVYYKFFNIFDLRIKKFVSTFNEKHDLMKMMVYKGGQSEYETEDVVKLVIHLKVNQETRYFDKSKKMISVHELNEQDTIVGLIKTKGIFMDTKAANYRWTGVQILKFNSD